MSNHKLKERLCEIQQNKCFWCGREMLSPSEGASLPLSPTIDHIQTNFENRNAPENKKAACYECNQLRSAFNPSAVNSARRVLEKENTALKQKLTEQRRLIERLTDQTLVLLEQKKSLREKLETFLKEKYEKYWNRCKRAECQSELRSGRET